MLRLTRRLDHHRRWRPRLLELLRPPLRCPLHGWLTYVPKPIAPHPLGPPHREAHKESRSHLINPDLPPRFASSTPGAFLSTAPMVLCPGAVAHLLQLGLPHQAAPKALHLHQPRSPLHPCLLFLSTPHQRAPDRLPQHQLLHRHGYRWIFTSLLLHLTSSLSTKLRMGSQILPLAFVLENLTRSAISK
ncbi:unnamed protein product [Ilex paraguariensis]|uniref:Uncharacterized protein n=1 Tax=Ilex paraguariensis TaxID=185542 RepID=A0ABC8RD85_9AQUA